MGANLSRLLTYISRFLAWSFTSTRDKYNKDGGISNANHMSQSVLTIYHSDSYVAPARITSIVLDLVNSERIKR